MNTFAQWMKQRSEAPTLAAANPRSLKTKRDRDRLIRMEALLRELVYMKQIIEQSTIHGNA